MELILIARLLEFDEETYIIVEDRDEPICPYCDGKLEPQGDDDDDVLTGIIVQWAKPEHDANDLTSAVLERLNAITQRIVDADSGTDAR